MGSYVSRGAAGGSRSGGKVVLSDGTVQALGGATTVAELMLEYPQQVVIDLRSLVAAGTTARPRPLPAEHRLHRRRVYLMLHMTRLRNGGGGGGALSAGEARRLLSRSRSIFPKSGRLFRQGALEEAEETEAVSSAAFWRGAAAGARCLSRQISAPARGWTPSLHTIEEKDMQRKVRLRRTRLL